MGTNQFVEAPWHPCARIDSLPAKPHNGPGVGGHSHFTEEDTEAGECNIMGPASRGLGTSIEDFRATRRVRFPLHLFAQERKAEERRRAQE